METESRAWFNPNLITRWFIVPGLIAVLVLINSILSGSLSIAREREEGTFDQLLVAPYTPGESCSAREQPPSSPESCRPSS